MIQAQTIAPKPSYLALLIDGVEVDVRGSADLLLVLASTYRRHRRERKRSSDMVRGLRLRLLTEHGSATLNASSAGERIIRGVAGCSGRYVVRAAALERDGRALLIVGLPGAGKSTVAINLLANGWKLLADDYVLLSADGTTAIAHQALIALSARSTPHLPALFRRALERSRCFSADGGRDIRFYEVDTSLVFGPNVWSDRARLDAIVLLTPSGSDSRVRDVDAEAGAKVFGALALSTLPFPQGIRIGALGPNRATRCAESIDAWFDAHSTS